MSNKNTLTEKQTFNQVWLHTLLSVLIATITLLLIYYWNDNNNRVHFFIVLFIILIVYILIIFSKLEYSISSETLSYRFFPFHCRKRNIDIINIAKIEPIEFNSLFEMGGWGIRKIQKGWAFTTSGKKGIKIELKNGNIIIIGTKKKLTEINSFLKEKIKL